MLKKISINFEAVEAMLYFWQAIKDKENIPEKFIYDIAEMTGMKEIYDEEFDGESVRKVLSAIKNREVLAFRTKKEARFWNNNLWMMEDLEYANSMVQPIKKLNLDDLADGQGDKEIEVIFAPFHFDEYLLKDNKLIINFFKLKPDEDLKTRIKGILE